MKAFVANGQWAPRSGYALQPHEAEKKRADCGSQVWKNPVFSMQEVPVPEISGHEVLVRVEKCGICGSDSHLYETDAEGYIIFSGPVSLPCTIGHEYAGVVEKVGKDVRDLAVGDPVAAESIIWCGQCAPCRSGAPNQCVHADLAGITVNGALAEYVTVNERQLWKIDSLSRSYSDQELFEIGALIEPVGCAYNGLFISGGGFLPGAVVVVYGAGPIGLGAAALASLAGASQVIVFDTVQERLNIASQLGATHTCTIQELAAAESRPRDLVMELTSGRGANIQVEAAGAALETVPEMETSLAVNGTIVYLGRTGKAASLSLDSFVTGANRIVGARGHAGYGIYANIIELLATGRLHIEEMITCRFPFAETVTGLEQSTLRRDGKIIIHLA
jgi:threonine dehydrogenase-like Zn-dependent dehydrogenase